MALILKEAMPMNAFLMLVEDEHGEQQIMIRMMRTNDGNQGTWLQGNLTGDTMRRLDGQEMSRVEETILPQLGAYVFDIVKGTGLEEEVSAILADMAAKVA